MKNLGGGQVLPERGLFTEGLVGLLPLFVRERRTERIFEPWRRIFDGRGVLSLLGDIRAFDRRSRGSSASSS